MTHFVAVGKNMHQCDICLRIIKTSGKSKYNLLRHVRLMHPTADRSLRKGDMPSNESSDASHGDSDASADEESTNDEYDYNADDETADDESTHKEDEDSADDDSADDDGADDDCGNDERTDDESADDESADDESVEDESADEKSAEESDDLSQPSVSTGRRNATQNDIDFLRVLQGATKRRREKLLRSADPHILGLIADCCESLLWGISGATVEEKKLMQPHRQTIRTLAKQDVSSGRQRKLLVQKGGFLPLLLPGPIQLLTSLLGL